ncbi:MAG: hypothetical protein NTY22_07490 [Proteobacteria bacterium]|nr:hypothetical protein [Pseudomonadota bacterium]
MLFAFLLFSSLIFADTEQKCAELDKAYILGDYKDCSSGIDENLSIRCKYLKAICEMADYSYDKSRYELSLISADVKAEKFDEFNGLALTSLAEIAFLQGDYKRAKTLSFAVNDVLIKKLPLSYSYFISELLLIKSYIDSRNLSEANKKIKIMKISKVDDMLFSSLDPWQ